MQENFGLIFCTQRKTFAFLVAVLSGKKKTHINASYLGGRFGYFLFFLLGGGKGESEAPGGGWERFLMENPRRGVSWVGGGGGPRGRESVCGEFCGGGGLSIFFGAEIPTKIHKPFEEADNPHTTSRLTTRNASVTGFGGEHINFFVGLTGQVAPGVGVGYLCKSLLTPQIARNHPKPQIFPKSGVAPKSPRNSH